jgi:transposase
VDPDQRKPVLVRALRPGDIIVIDNLSGHKGAKTRAPVEIAGAGLPFLPPCSPDFQTDRKGVHRVKRGLWERKLRGALGRAKAA